MPSYPVTANIVFTYYDDLARAADFYAKVLELDLVVDQGWAKIYQVTPSSFLGVVDGARGAHKPSKDKPVNLSFVTGHVDDWYAHLQAKGVTIHRPLNTREDIGIRGFMAVGPEGYILEFEEFLPNERNRGLLAVLNA
jgi:predicted enzyme related to lactoylglutathione lyase